MRYLVTLCSRPRHWVEPALEFCPASGTHDACIRLRHPPLLLHDVAPGTFTRHVKRYALLSRPYDRRRRVFCPVRARNCLTYTLS